MHEAYGHARTLHAIYIHAHIPIATHVGIWISVRSAYLLSTINGYIPNFRGRSISYVPSRYPAEMASTSPAAFRIEMLLPSNTTDSIVVNTGYMDPTATTTEASPCVNEARVRWISRHDNRK